MKVTYAADGPGQASEIKIAGQVYHRGHAYVVTAEVAADLLRRGGFYEAKPKRLAKAAKIEMENE